MARHTKTKFAALAVSLVAALGIVATAPMTSADAGHAKTSFRGGYDTCC